MHYPFYENHKNKRVSKIIEILGVDWFKDKTILELGACHGDIGIEFIKLGSHVTFADAREENLNEIYAKIEQPDIIVLNQNKPYNLGRRYDLVLHLGTLWHIENWHNDLYCALRHSDRMILETKVLPKNVNISLSTNTLKSKYNAFGEKESCFTDVAVEKKLIELNIDYVRYDDANLNTNFEEMAENVYVKHIYDWTIETPILSSNKQIHHRRFWYVGL
jgi:hypothetical protein